jgi:MinD-like ATPase involved in chromosome partitioning or flagellar assembly
MGSVVLFSAKGAPGVTTTAMLIASLWPRPALLVDCDPAGGDVGLRLPAPDGSPLDLGTGVLSLLPLARRRLEPGTLLEHSQQVLGGGEVIVGLTGPEQAAAAGATWNTIARALADLDSHQVIVDAGRLDPTSPVLPAARAADLAVCVVDASVTGVFAARARLRTVLPALAARDGIGPKFGVIVRGDRQADADSALAVIKSEFADVGALGFVPTDPVGVRMFHGERVSRPERTMIARSGADLVGELGNALYVAYWSGREGEQEFALPSYVAPQLDLPSEPGVPSDDSVAPGSAEPADAPRLTRSERHRRHKAGRRSSRSKDVGWRS